MPPSICPSCEASINFCTCEVECEIEIGFCCECEKAVPAGVQVCMTCLDFHLWEMQIEMGNK